MSWRSGRRLPGSGNRYIPVSVRDKVWAIDEGICQYCGGAGETYDHVYPFAQEGTHHYRNLVLACRTCNSIAGEAVFTEFYRKKMYVLERRMEMRKAGEL